MGRPARIPARSAGPATARAEAEALEQLDHLERWTCGPRPLVAGIAPDPNLARDYHAELSRLEAAGISATDRLDAMREWCSAHQRAAPQRETFAPSA